MRGRGRPVGMLEQIVDKAVFEPAHFIMERRMMLSIKDLAERGQREAVTAETQKQQLTPV